MVASISWWESPIDVTIDISNEEDRTDVQQYSLENQDFSGFNDLKIIYIGKLIYEISSIDCKIMINLSLKIDHKVEIISF